MNPSPLLMRHFTQALRGIGALKSFDPTVIKVENPHGEVINHISRRYPRERQARWVDVMMSDNTGYRPGRVLVAVTYERVTWNDRANRQYRSLATDNHLFTNPILAAEYVARLFGYTQPAECLCDA